MITKKKASKKKPASKRPASKKPAAKKRTKLRSTAAKNGDASRKFEASDLVRDRIKEFKRIPASSIKPHPDNWRTHSDDQRNALSKVLADVGIVDVCIVFEYRKGYMLIDGHLRQEELAANPDQLIPCIVLDVSAAEAKKILLYLDPLCTMAGVDLDKLHGLMDSVDEAANELAKEIVSFKAGTKGGDGKDGPEVNPVFQVVCELKSEKEQRECLALVESHGFQAKVLTL